MYRICSKKVKRCITQTYFITKNNQRNIYSEKTQEHEELSEAVIPQHLFSASNIGKFFQEQPTLGNQYSEDVTLQSYLRRHIPKKIYRDIELDLVRFGKRVATDIYDLHLECENEPPRLEQYDAWGKRVDKLITSTAWKKMHDLAAEEGLIAIAYNREFGEWSRLYQIAKLYLYSPSAGLYSCPLAMTDGAAKIMETLQESEPWLMNRAFSRLTSRLPSSFWTSGQWMTERRGGSDVANGTETMAVPQPGGSYKLYGYKWFSSATDADITFTLARVVDVHGKIKEGTQGLSLFYLETRKSDGQLNNIQIQRLKNKLGTRQLPTAELLLDGTNAYRVSEEGRGVAAISNMLKLTRIHNALASVGAMRRIVNMARDYSTRRTAFGNKLKNYPLHIQTLARMEVETRGATLLLLEIARLLGREDVAIATDHEQQLVRILTPLAKLYTGKQAVKVVSEGLESFGGQGYMEDTGLPSILRDAQVTTIWEGTTNILSLDLLRAIAKSQGEVMNAFYKDVQHRLATANQKEDLVTAAAKVKQSVDNIVSFIRQNTNNLEISARDLAYSLSRNYIAALMLEHASVPTATSQDVYAAQRWCEKDLCPVVRNSEHYTAASQTQEFQLLFDGYHDKSRL
ncbi:hypothetical protein CHS0354_003235 [Potamilus streckersoni]|uniref:Acyl-CoA dehydrogenase n=1 Tax=Potamilus streckersoni TaxID=2493646 RepID=A0AAE0RYU3_9BIVA|nr:hypothetical protein CHS0354_003235 [Potamilus streckersoni]